MTVLVTSQVRLTVLSYLNSSWAVVDPEKVQGVRSNPHLWQNYSIFMENFQKNHEKIANNQLQSANRTPLCKFEPPIKKSWIRPCCGLGHQLSYTGSYGICSKILNTFLFLFSNKMLVFRAGIHKMLVRRANTVKPVLSGHSKRKKIVFQVR